MNSPMSAWPLTGWAIAFAMLGGGLASGQVCEDFGRVLGEVRIGQGPEGLPVGLSSGDAFGSSVAAIGDLDRDGSADLAVGAILDDDGGNAAGAVWILFLDDQHRIKRTQKISPLSGGLGFGVDTGDWFGRSIAPIGDLDGDGVGDLAVGAQWDDDGGSNSGSVWILFMRPDGTVKSKQKLSATSGGLTGVVQPGDQFGFAVRHLGDWFGDGLTTIAVGASGDDDGGADRGALYLIALAADGTAARHQKLSSTEGGFGAGLANGDYFGSSATAVGDLDNDGVVDLVVGARYTSVGGVRDGGAWLLRMNPDGTVKRKRRIDASSLPAGAGIRPGDQFGAEIDDIGDVDGNGAIDLVITSPYADDGGDGRGALRVLLMAPDGSVLSTRTVSQTDGRIVGPLLNQGNFGSAVATMKSPGLTGGLKLVVGANAYGAPLNAGEVWVVSIAACLEPPDLVAQPESVLLPPADGMAVLRVGAVGTDPLTYTWRRGGVPLENTRTVLGVDSPTLTVEATEADEGVYDCVVSNAYGSVTSNPAVLGVIAAPRTADVNGDGRRDIFDVIAFFELFTE